MRGDPGRHGLERGAERGRIFAAALRHVRTPAAFAADLPGDIGHEIAGFYLAERLAVHARDERDLAVAAASEQHYAVAEFLFELVDAVAQRFRIGAVETRGDDLDAVYIFRHRSQVRCRRRGGLRFQ